MKAEQGKGKFAVISNLVIKCELITEFHGRGRVERHRGKKHGSEGVALEGRIDVNIGKNQRGQKNVERV